MMMMEWNGISWECQHHEEAVSAQKYGPTLWHEPLRAAYLKMSGFTPIEFWPFWGLSPHLTFHNVKNHGGGGEERCGGNWPGAKSDALWPAVGRFSVQGSGFSVIDVWEDQRGDRGEASKWKNIHYGVKPDIFKITPSSRGELHSHPLAGQAQVCGRLTKVEKLKGLVAPIVTTGGCS